MGLESYRIGVKFLDAPSFENLKNILVSFGVTFLESNEMGIEMEAVFSNCIIELLISKVMDRKKILENISGKKNKSLSFNSDNIGETLLNIRFAKLNPPEVIDEIIYLLRKLDKVSKLKLIWDLESKCEIDLNSYETLKRQYSASQINFNKWFNFSYKPIRCKDVFKDINCKSKLNLKDSQF